MKNQKSMSIQICFRKRVAKLPEQCFLESVRKYRWDFESGPARCGPASVTGHVINKHERTKN